MSFPLKQSGGQPRVLRLPVLRMSAADSALVLLGLLTLVVLAVTTHGGASPARPGPGAQPYHLELTDPGAGTGDTGLRAAGPLWRSPGAPRGGAQQLAAHEQKLTGTEVDGAQMYMRRAAGMPQVALTAYRAAAAAMQQVDPGCHLQWPVLAAIGRVESDHGRFGGSMITAAGMAMPSIRGPVLNGVGVARIGDSDGGRLDGDPTFDRAVGPMQFIPATWRAFASDGNGDGVMDPQNIFDSTLAAARYLCAGPGDLSTSDGLRAAVLRYNHSQAYADMVIGLAAAYASGTPVSGPVPVIPNPPAVPASVPVQPASPTTPTRIDQTVPGTPATRPPGSPSSGATGATGSPGSTGSTTGIPSSPSLEAPPATSGGTTTGSTTGTTTGTSTGTSPGTSTGSSTGSSTTGPSTSTSGSATSTTTGTATTSGSAGGTGSAAPSTSATSTTQPDVSSSTSVSSSSSCPTATDSPTTATTTPTDTPTDSPTTSPTDTPTTCTP